MLAGDVFWGIIGYCKMRDDAVGTPGLRHSNVKSYALHVDMYFVIIRFF